MDTFYLKKVNVILCIHIIILYNVGTIFRTFCWRIDDIKVWFLFCVVALLVRAFVFQFRIWYFVFHIYYSIPIQLVLFSSSISTWVLLNFVLFFRRLVCVDCIICRQHVHTSSIFISISFYTLFSLFIFSVLFFCVWMMMNSWLRWKYDLKVNNI